VQEKFPRSPLFVAVVVVCGLKQADVGVKKDDLAIIDTNKTVFEVNTTGADRFDLTAF
jgi:hypothetical protein